MPTAVTLIPGDGIGPEITDAAVRVLEASGAKFAWDVQLAGMAAVSAHGTPIPAETLESIERTRLALKGPLETPVGGGYRSVNVELRRRFDLYANLRPSKTILPGGRFEHVDIVLVRENTEGLYSGVEHFVKIGADDRAVAESVAIITREGSLRIARYAFEYAVQHARKKVTVVHKANILKLSQGLFLDCARTVAKEYAGRIALEERIIDACAMQLVMKPEAFDVIVTTNLFGDILSDQISGLVGGLGLAPGANIGEKAAIFEAVHGTAPDIAGQGKANPGALLLAACLMLEHTGDGARAARIRTAFETTVREKKTVTPDLGGTATTSQFADAIIARVA
ncbi:MAG TPA: isocitrate/isopropylmalate family dehydrogenase [Gemmatimonadaceae bacterium]|jgi:isocitrate dehydrogenase (NAD+)|nr:isocitrate/isopropylmalate family dehydrogenase [Gemmatimonadaceae bacterium]